MLARATRFVRLQLQIAAFTHRCLGGTNKQPSAEKETVQARRTNSVSPTASKRRPLRGIRQEIACQPLTKANHKCMRTCWLNFFEQKWVRSRERRGLVVCRNPDLAAERTRKR